MHCNACKVTCTHLEIMFFSMTVIFFSPPGTVTDSVFWRAGSGTGLFPACSYKPELWDVWGYTKAAQQENDKQWTHTMPGVSVWESIRLWGRFCDVARILYSNTPCTCAEVNAQWEFSLAPEVLCGWSRCETHLLALHSCSPRCHLALLVEVGPHPQAVAVVQHSCP